MMIVFNGMDLIGLAIGAVLLVICGIFLLVCYIEFAVKERKQKRAYKLSKHGDE